MLEIKLDLGDVPSVLETMADQNLYDKLAKVAAQTYVDETMDWIAAGKGFTPRSPGGGLEQSIGWRGVGNGQAEVYANKDYAGYVEHGTGVHVGHSSWVIGPKPGRKGVAFKVSGGEGFIVRRSVIHHGSKPHPFFFADQDNRKERMQEEMVSVLAAHMHNAT